MMERKKKGEKLITLATIILTGCIAAVSVRAQVSLSISNLKVITRDTSAIITFETNQMSQTRVDFGTAIAYDRFIDSGQTRNLIHNITLPTLKPETEYHYRITCSGTDGKISTFDRTFKTLKGKRTEGPTISDVSAIYITGASATIQWRTDKLTSSLVRFGSTATYTASKAGRGRTTVHDVTIGGLTMGATYHFRVEATDADGYTAVSSDATFTTPVSLEGERSKLEISEVQPLAAGSGAVTAVGVTISWRTNKLTAGSVAYGTSSRLSHTVTGESPRRFQHEIIIGGLQADTTYYFKISAVDVFNARAESPVYSFKTLQASGASSKSPGSGIKWITLDGSERGDDREVNVLGISTTDYSEPTAVIRAQGSPEVYAVFAERKLYIPSYQSLKRFGFGWEDVRTVRQETLNSYPPIQLVRVLGNGRVYYIYHRPGNHRIKIHLSSPSIFSSYPNNRWNFVVTVDEGDLQGIPDAKLVKTASNPAVYLLEGTRVQSFENSAAFERLGFRWADIVGISEAHLASFVRGNPIR